MAARAGKHRRTGQRRFISLASLLWVLLGFPALGLALDRSGDPVVELTPDEPPETEEEALDTIQEPFPFPPPVPDAIEDAFRARVCCSVRI